MSLAKTRKRSPSPVEEEVKPQDVSGSFLGSLSSQSNQFYSFLHSHANDAYTRPWHRLERGVRLNRLRLFAHEEHCRCALSDADTTALFQVLTKMLDKKLLNSKTIVTYDTEQQKILEIKGLVSHKHADGRVVYQFVERKPGVTSRKSSSSSSTGSRKNTATTATDASNASNVSNALGESKTDAQ